MDAAVAQGRCSGSPFRLRRWRRRPGGGRRRAGHGVAGRGAREALAVPARGDPVGVGLRLRGGGGEGGRGGGEEEEEGEARRAGQPRVAPGLQRRVRLRRVHERRRGRRLLLPAGSRVRHRRAQHQAGGWPRRTAVDPPGAAASARRAAAAEEDEAPGDPTAGAVAVGGERRPPRGNEGVAEGLHGAVQGERQARDKARSLK